jgi:hypothetical protein
MSFDLRRCSKEELDAINDRAQAWRAQRLPEQCEHSADEAVSPLEESPADIQLTLNLQ